MAKASPSMWLFFHITHIQHTQLYSVQQHYPLPYSESTAGYSKCITALFSDVWAIFFAAALTNLCQCLSKPVPAQKHTPVFLGGALLPIHPEKPLICMHIQPYKLGQPEFIKAGKLLVFWAVFSTAAQLKQEKWMQARHLTCCSPNTKHFLPLPRCSFPISDSKRIWCLL